MPDDDPRPADVYRKIFDDPGNLDEFLRGCALPVGTSL